MHRHVDGQHQRRQARIGGALDQILGDLAVARGIELVPRVFRRDPGSVLDGLVAGAGLDVDVVRLARRLGQHHVGATAEEARAAGRRNSERAGEFLPEDRRRLVALGHVDEVARQKVVLLERLGVAVEPALVLEPALDEVEGDLRQPPFRHLVQVFDIDGVVESHGSPLPDRHRTLCRETSPISALADNAEVPRAGLVHAERSLILDGGRLARILSGRCGRDARGPARRRSRPMPSPPGLLPSPSDRMSQWELTAEHLPTRTREEGMAPVVGHGLSDSEHSAQLRRAVVASTVGTVIEAYDFLLYVLVAPLVFAKLFFPDSDPLVGTLQAFGIYAVGFIARPIGAAFFGHFGDRIGRKVTLIATLLLTGLS